MTDRAAYDAAIARAVVEFAAGIATGELRNVELMKAVELAGGLYPGDLVNREIWRKVTGEIADRHFADLGARLGPKIDALDPESGLAVDEALAQIAADLKAG